MSVIHVNQIANKIVSLFKDDLDTSDIQRHKDLEDNILTRCLAAYAIYNHAACSAKEAAASIIDGGDDNGIDAIFYSPSLKELILVQAKWIKNGRGEPDSSEIAKFCSGVEDLINLDFDRFNEKVGKRLAEIESAISSFDTRYTLILAYTGDKGIAEHGKRKVEDLVNKLNDAGEGPVDELVRFKKFDQARIYTSLSKGLISDPINVEIGLHQWGKYEEPFIAFYGFITGDEIAKIWSQNGRKLFHKNIRNVLGKTEVNDELLFTIQKSPDKFWYFNNGITIISDSIEKSLAGGTSRDMGIFKLTNASVVNGAQTINSIGENAEKYPDQLRKIHVLVRCISLENTPQDFDNEVTKANNRQNRIENRDFVSLDPEQDRLKEELAHDGINYNIMRSDTFIRSNKSFEVEEATISLASASENVALAVQAKREVGKFYENLEKGIYKQIYNPSTTGRYVYNCVIVNRHVESLIADKISALARRSGKEYGILIHGNRLLTFLICKRMRIPNAEMLKIQEAELYTLFIETLSRMTAAINSRFSDNILATLFKNRAKCEELVRLCEDSRQLSLQAL